MATKEEKQAAKEAARQEAAARSSQNPQSDPSKESLAEKSERTGGDVDGTNTQEETLKDAVEKSKEVADGGAGDSTTTENADGEEVTTYELPEGYDPMSDPIIPSSDVAQTVAAELTSLGESPTLKGLHEAADEANKSDK